MEYDLLIKNGTIVDGTGNDSFEGDIAVHDGEIKEIGSIESSAKETIDAEGRTVAIFGFPMASAMATSDFPPNGLNVPARLYRPVGLAGHVSK